MSVLVLAEHDHRSLKSSTLHTLAAAAKLGGDVHVLYLAAERARPPMVWEEASLGAIR